MSSRSQRKCIKTVVTQNKRIESSWIMLLKDLLFDNNTFSIVTLPHPALKNPAKYCLDHVHNRMYEVVTFNEPYRSWFIGETVKSDGSIQMLTPINPLFLVLPRLRKLCSSRAVPLEDLMSEKGFEKIIKFISNMDIIADLKGQADIKAYKYNEDKTILWLEGRVRKLAEVLRKKNLHVTSGAVSATFVTSNIDNQDVDEEFYLKYAHGIVSEYLEDDLVEILEKRFNFKPELVESLGKKRKSEQLASNDTKKIKCEDLSKENEINAFNSCTEVKKQKPLTAKEKARQKAASGTKTLSAFFTKE